MRFKGATGVAAVAATGNFLQGWDIGATAGALLYLKPEFHLESTPTLEGLVVASTFFGAAASVIVAGPAADRMGRKFVLLISGLLYSTAAMLMLWTPTVNILILSRVVVGLAIGLATTIAPVLISESAPTETRGQLATFPQLLGSSGLFFAYVMAFVLSLQDNPNWRSMLGVLAIPSFIYAILCLFALPESPRWLVSKGRMYDAKVVLQNLREEEDVSELALLVEGVGVVAECRLEEWLIKPTEDEDYEQYIDGNQIKLFAPDERVNWVATPIVDDWGSQHHSGLARTGNRDLLSVFPKVDPMVTLLGSFQNTDHFMHSREFFDDDYKPEHWDEEAPETPRFGGNGYYSETDIGGMVGDRDAHDHLRRPLLGGSNYGSGRFGNAISRGRNAFSMFAPAMSFRTSPRISPRISPQRSTQSSRPSTCDSAVPESLGSVGVGGGWQLAWQKDAKDGSLKRVYLKSEGGDLSNVTQNPAGFSGLVYFHGDHITFPAAVLVAQTAINRALLNEHPVGPATLNPTEAAKHSHVLSSLMEGGVRRALAVGVGMQVLQQLCGINVVLHFIPQILMQSGAGELLESIGIEEESASILASGVTCLLMLPCILMAIWLIDKSGRRQLLLATIPILVISLVALVLANMFLPTGLMAAAISYMFIVIFTCSSVAGFGPVPNILCTEIFPTSVRGLGVGICAAAMWGANILVTYSFPLVNQLLGLQGVFGFFAMLSVVAWIFAFLKVPETKGLPLEIISEFFAMVPSKREKDGHKAVVY
ncbi:monosaccharide-sensing protein 2 isoform X2 [Physcomitrium patens]|uniref:monosaccharide-sensing protein 2 isoform X2 n=1 Tax=Physcomitrium patens TaxID=3218 RepID=UPI000D172D62|nr:monosaccharide-sensing protein 2-like isoform X2 [Physcomitrium patens]|eukprot:XP_024361211.1 monosaccharide-sensing protein 2-like isoform X2 [Physcomitrella patens]